MRGKSVKPAIETATGTSSLQGMAALTTTQQTESHRRRKNNNHQWRRVRKGKSISVVSNQSAFYQQRQQQLTMTLRIQDGATVIFTLATNHTKGNQAGSAGLAAEFAVAATDSNLSRCTQGVQSRVNRAVGAAEGTAKDSLLFVNGVFHTHDESIESWCSKIFFVVVDRQREIWIRDGADEEREQQRSSSFLVGMKGCFQSSHFGSHETEHPNRHWQWVGQ